MISEGLHRLFFNHFSCHISACDLIYLEMVTPFVIWSTYRHKTKVFVDRLLGTSGMDSFHLKTARVVRKEFWCLDLDINI